MGCHENITFDKFPKQGSNLGKLVEVIFHYDTSNYPEEWIKYYCVRCGKLVSYSDNGEVRHTLMDFKDGNI